MSVWWNRSQVLPIPGLAEWESGCVTCWHSRRGQRPQRGGHWPFRGGLKWKCSCNSICFFWRHDSRFRLLAWNVNCGISVLVFAAFCPIVFSVGDCGSQVFIAVRFAQEPLSMQSLGSKWFCSGFYTVVIIGFYQLMWCKMCKQLFFLNNEDVIWKLWRTCNNVCSY